MMKVFISAKYQECVCRFVLPVGDGKQNFLWLGHAAATMYVLLNAPAMPLIGGRCLIEGSVASTSQLLPVNIYSDLCTFYHPEDSLCESLTEKQEIKIDLVDNFGIDVENNQRPLLTKWAFIAFRTGPLDRKEREQLIREKTKERDDYRSLRENQDIALRLARNRPRIAHMKHVLREQLCSEAIVKKVALKEWDNIAASVILDKTVPREADQQVLRGLMIKHHPDVSALFKFFSSINSGGSTDTVEFIEFNKFFIETEVFGDGDHSGAILRIFVESQSSSERMGASVNVHSEMKRHEFFISLVKVALYKYVTLERRRIAKLRRLGHETGVSFVSMSAPQAFERLFADYLKPAIDRIGGLLVRDYLGCDEVLLLLFDRLQVLVKVFNHYAELSTPARDTPKGFSPTSVRREDNKIEPLPSDFDVLTYKEKILPSGLMSLKGFSRFVNEGSFVGATDALSGIEDEGVVSATSIRQIFAASQHDWLENEDEIKLELQASAGEARRHQEMMSFAEFIEALIRIGLTSNDVIRGQASDEGFYRIERAVNTTCNFAWLAEEIA